MNGLSFGFPRIHKEPGEHRDFLPDLIHVVAGLGAPVAVEHGLGSALGYRDDDYVCGSPHVRVADAREVFAQDVVVVLRSPDERFQLLRPGTLLVSMLHFPTRPARVGRLLGLGVDAVSLDSIADDDGTRLVENMRAVAWNGLDAAFETLAGHYPEMNDPRRDPIRVTILGAGHVGKHAVEAATKYGSLERDRWYSARGVSGVEVTVVGRNLTAHRAWMLPLLARTDILVDASQRSSPERPLVPNDWLAWLPPHAVVCDLVADPYLLDGTPPTVRSIEGIPLGSLDQWMFAPEDPAWCATIPRGIPTRHRRTVVSCYSWPGVRPEPCMRHYGRQLAPLLRTLIERGGAARLRPDGPRLERALSRSTLRGWADAHGVATGTRPRLLTGVGA